MLVKIDILSRAADTLDEPIVSINPLAAIVSNHHSVNVRF